ncbi:DUF6257 family protein [Streptomyces sp. NPDC008079]|uniref:DUF6257 family protein n=1 Tax=Streptomyces sp. NPDC008079 TaxID=3364806 RepID=UPI0036DFC0A8
MIRTHPDDPPLTGAEASRIAWLVARMTKRGLAGEEVDQSDLQAGIDSILKGARRREEREEWKTTARRPT